MWNKIFKIATKSVTQKSSIVVLILLSISMYYLGGYVGSEVVFSYTQEYWTQKNWPTEIKIYKTTDTHYNFSAIVNNISNFEGVKWYVYPGGGILIRNDSYKYNGEQYYLEIKWCNVEDPTFPNSKYLIEGNFFRTNSENTIILESVGKQFFKDLGLYKGLGKNKTVLSVLGFNMSVIGIIASPILIGREEGYLKLTNVIDIYVPLHTYMRIVQKIKTQNYENNATINGGIYVKVKEGYDVEKVAEKIRNTYPGINVFTISEEKRILSRMFLQMTLINAGIPYVLATIVMLWDVKHNESKTALLKVLGWRRRDILKLFILKYFLMGIVGGLLGLALSFTSFITMPPNLYIIYQVVMFIPIQILLGASTALLFAIPAVIKAYSVNAEKVMRS